MSHNIIPITLHRQVHIHVHLLARLKAKEEKTEDKNNMSIIRSILTNIHQIPKATTRKRQKGHDKFPWALFSKRSQLQAH